jgi:hypothetical protein
LISLFDLIGYFQLAKIIHNLDLATIIP